MLDCFFFFLMLAIDDTSVKYGGACACDALLVFAGMKHADGFAMAVPMKHGKIAKVKYKNSDLMRKCGLFVLLRRDNLKITVAPKETVTINAFPQSKQRLAHLSPFILAM